MGIGKRTVGILCGVLLCLVLVLVLHSGKKEEETGESPKTESTVEQAMTQNNTFTPYETKGAINVEPAEIPETEETPEPQEESTSAPTQSPKPAETETPVPKPTATSAPTAPVTPVPMITPSPIPVVAETEPPKVEQTPAPIPNSTPVPEVTGKEEEEHKHEFVMSVWELPTCQKSGYYNNVCKSCGVVECVTQEPIPHEIEDIVIQEGNCMEDTVIRHICKMCEQQVKSDTRYTVYDKHLWGKEWVDGVEVEYCEWCGVAK